jgi:hypothetical protein
VCPLLGVGEPDCPSWSLGWQEPTAATAAFAWFRHSAPRAPAAGTRLPEAPALRSERSRGSSDSHAPNSSGAVVG